MSDQVDPTRIYTQLKGLYDEFLVVHEASGLAIVEAINALSRKAEADKAFLDAFHHLVPRKISSPPPVPQEAVSPPTPNGPGRDPLHIQRLREALTRDEAYD